MNDSTWKFIKIGLVVTGEGEREFAADLFQSILETGKCTFPILRQTGQRRAIRDERQRAYNATGKVIPDRDAEIGAQIRGWLRQNDSHFAIWLDDLESAHRSEAAGKFSRLRKAVDVMLAKEPKLKPRFSAHLLVNMLEAYYFAQASAVNEVLETTLTNHVGDCENIPHPKNELKRLARAAGKSFDEKADGAKIVPKLDIESILGNPNSCRALRTLVAWCWEALGEARTDRFQLNDGIYWDITARQLCEQPAPDRILPLEQEKPYQPAGTSGGS